MHGFHDRGTDASPPASGQQEHVMGVTGVCAKEHIFWSPGTLQLTVNRRIDPMDEQTHKGISWRKLMSVLGALLVTAAPMSGFVCAARDCLPQNTNAVAACTSMDMPKDARPVIAQSPVACCQFTPSPPAAIRQSTDAQACKVDLSSRVSGTLFPGLVTTQRMAPSQAASPPPHDVQSLFCTLLI